MYKLLLCWRYLLTRYLALACIISVMLGVATLIVVNSVMSGFSAKLKERMHSFLSDVIVEAVGLEGMADVEGRMELIRRDEFLGPRIEAMSPVMEIFALAQFEVYGETVTKTVHVIGVDPRGRQLMGGWAERLVDPENQREPSFELRGEALQRYDANHRPMLFVADQPQRPGDKPGPLPPPVVLNDNPRGVIVGYAIAHFRYKKEGQEAQDICLLPRGADVILMTLGGQRIEPVYERMPIADYYKSEMSEQDSQYIFVPLDWLQHLRTMEGRATSIQIKLRDYNDAKAVTERLKSYFPDNSFLVSTWEQKQGALLGAISIERGLLNILLFLIIAVAGFGILAIFSMIVVEKTRDIGILKALGASNIGVMKIFLGYGLLLGIVGASAGTGIGLVITNNINQIEQRITKLTGHEVFDRSIYYFSSIPTDIQMNSVLLVDLGAIGIAVLFSVLPALRAAMLQPVRALRYE
jgi:lipoprotein-releasing system permease protein